MLVNVQSLSREDYERIRRLVYTQSGINLGDQKLQLVRARLGKRMRKHGFTSFGDYYDYVEQDATGEELVALLDAISTNTTHLFREPRHFDFLRQALTQWLGDKAWCSRHSTLRIWSAGCSSGEEPHSIAMVAHDVVKNHPGVSLKILATDLSTQMLSKAQLGVYGADRIEAVPPQYKSRYLTKVQREESPGFQVCTELRRHVTFARFNLMTPSFPFHHGFHVIFCRNVMIYFDRQTQETLVNKFAQHLVQGGYLLIGHSESLSRVKHPLAYVEPTIYRRD